MKTHVPTRGLLVVPLEQLHPLADEPFPGSQSCEASDLGIRPGRWPQTVVVRADQGSLGFTYQDADIDREGDLQAVIYRSPEGFRLTLWND